jgi:hypothetical protein
MFSDLIDDDLLFSSAGSFELSPITFTKTINSSEYIQTARVDTWNNK